MVHKFVYHEHMIIQFGICDCCNVTRILERVKKRIRTTSEYTEVTLILSNGSLATHGICRSCKEKFTDADSKRVIQNITDTWKRDLGSTASPKQLERVSSITADSWATDEREAKQKLPSIKEKKHKEHLVKAKEVRDNNKEDK